MNELAAGDAHVFGAEHVWQVVRPGRHTRDVILRCSRRFPSARRASGAPRAPERSANARWRVVRAFLASERSWCAVTALSGACSVDLHRARSLQQTTAEVAMIRNEGSIDRAVRIIFGLMLLALVFVGPKTWLGLVGLVPLATGLVGFCPLYRFIGVRTCSISR
jgi:hypothetical protein